MIGRLLATQQRLVLMLALGLAVAGAACWLLMPRQEDPDFPARTGVLIVPFPGADAEIVERLVVEPVEEALAEVDGINQVGVIDAPLPRPVEGVTVFARVGNWSVLWLVLLAVSLAYCSLFLKRSS